MFTWNIAKSADAMFSRWAVKRLCKFLLKKKLGKYILGDIDLDQLDVELRDGKIQLSDLALNVDYINQKLGTSAVFVKEGSIGSLMITMPWKDGGCRVTVDELEIVLAPRRVKTSEEFETCSRTQSVNDSFNHVTRKLDEEVVNWAANVVDVHEGVKVIAKIVKWLLTSFHVQIKKLIVAFDPILEEENESRLDRMLVLRIIEVECGMRISEDASSCSFTKVCNFLGFSRLTNFIQFQGAVLELLHVDGLLQRSPPEVLNGTNLDDLFSGKHYCGATTTIISGEKGGFSGNIKLSIPWKNGCLDVRKVDADLHIEPFELKFSPSSIRCFIFIYGLFKDIGGEECGDHGYQGHSNFSSALGSFDKGSLTYEGFAAECYSMEKDKANALLSESHLISDWASNDQIDKNEEEPDFGASMDQFFECFDELRNSQSALGNSGMWNWTCSMFSAITAASNLASGSLHDTSEQQNIETKFNATIEKISLLLTITDEDQVKPSEMKNGKANTNFSARGVCAQFIDLFLDFQVCPQETNFKLTVHHIKLVDHLYSENDLESFLVCGSNENYESEISSIHKMQDNVLSALQNFQESNKDHGIGHRGDCSVENSPSIQDFHECSHMTTIKDVFRKNSGVIFLKTSGITSCHVKVNSGSASVLPIVPVSLSLKLPPFVFWVNFDLISMILELVNKMSNCNKKTTERSGFVLDSESKKYGFSPLGGQGEISHSQASVGFKRSMEGNIFLPSARIILSFPIIRQKDFSSYASSKQFIAFDFVSSTTGGNDDRSAKPKPTLTSKTRHGVAPYCSLYFHLGSFYALSISSDFRDQRIKSGSNMRQEPYFYVEKIISAVSRTCHLPLISIFWQEVPTIGPWISRKAKLLASSEENARIIDKIDGKDSEFASVTTVQDITDFDTHFREEILSSSAFCLHVQLPPVTIHLNESLYENTCGLLNQVNENFMSTVIDIVRTQGEHAVSQASILLECDSVTFIVSIEPVSDNMCSTLDELPGSWLCLTLQVDMFEFLWVSNIGGIKSGNFLWVAHRQGSLYGSVTKDQHQEFLLISCNDSTMGRGDGEGSNVLSSRSSGLDIINLWDPESNHNLTSVTVRGATFIAIGGRLDWFNTMFSFFSLPSPELDQSNDQHVNEDCGSSFVVNLVDVGLTYAPYFKKLMTSERLDTAHSDVNSTNSIGEMHVSCVLAASLLKLSNASIADCATREYKIRLRDLGFLVSKVSQFNSVNTNYSAKWLNKTGYVRVAQEAHVEALLRTNCDNGLAWELECAELHIVLSTCHDTTMGLIRLASQLQKLFAPDMQDYVVHLENRWNHAQQAHDNTSEKTLVHDLPQSIFQSPPSGPGNEPEIGNLMNEICEGVFHLDENSDGEAKFFESHLHSSLNDSFPGEQSFSDSEYVSVNLSLARTVSSIGVGAGVATSLEEKIPELIEEYFLSDMNPLSEITLKRESSDSISGKSGILAEVQTENGMWYEDNSLRILENHASKMNEHPNQKLVENESSSNDYKHSDYGKAEGCIILRNTNVVWRMYGGSDWSKFQNTFQPSAMKISGRDATVCFELALSGIGFDYKFYPGGEVSASRLFLTINDFCLNDKSDHAPWKLVLGYYQSKKHPRKFSSKAVKLNLEVVRPDPSIPLEENRLSIALLPMRLHLHQSQLDFLINFFGTNDSSSKLSRSNPPHFGGKSGEQLEKNDNLQGSSISAEAFLTYFQKFDIWPFRIRVDYSPCRVDLTALGGGKYVELINLVPWKDVELKLKHVQGVGLYGWNSVCEAVLGEWLEDISQNQIHKLLRGLPPIKSLVAIGSGAAKLVSLPVKSYKKDHRLLKGMQRGAIAFIKSVSLEAIGLGVHLAAGAHNILLEAEYMLTNIPPSVPWPVESRVNTNVRSNQPKDARQGIHQACQSITDGLGKSASALVQIPLKKFQRGSGVGSTLATVVQATPAAAIAPASAAAHAVHCALLGFRNSLDPEHKRESVEKYLGRIPPKESIQ